MDTYILQLVTATAGSLGFALIFNVNRSLLLPASLGGFFAWGVYLLCAEAFGLNVLISNVVAGAFCQIYAEALARIMKTPSTVICIPSVIPLIPGGALYNTMYSAVHQDWEMFRHHGYLTLQTALGIAAGISFVSGILYILTRFASQKARK